MARKRLDGAVDKEWTTASVKMAVATKEAWRRLAEVEGRSMGNYLERLLNRESMEHEVTLYDVMGRLEVIHALLVVNGTKTARRKAKTPATESEGEETKPKPPKKGFNAYNLYSLFEAYEREKGEMVISKDHWMDWVDNCNESENPINNFFRGKKDIGKIIGFHEEGYNCESLIEDLILLNAFGIFMPNDFKKGKRVKRIRS
jgi:hypothetical protein